MESVSTLRTCRTSRRAITTCSQGSRKNWEANDLPHMRNLLPQLNVYSKIWVVASTAVVLKSSCFGSTNVYKKWELCGLVVNFVLPIKFFCSFSDLFGFFSGLATKLFVSPLYQFFRSRLCTFCVAFFTFISVFSNRLSTSTFSPWITSVTLTLRVPLCKKSTQTTSLSPCRY